MKSNEIYTFEKSYFSDKYATECQLRIFRCRWESTPSFKPLITHFQNIHLQCKNNRLPEYKLSADIN